MTLSRTNMRSTRKRSHALEHVSRIRFLVTLHACARCFAFASRRHPTIILLWEVIHELPVEQQKRFLFFCTGVYIAFLKTSISSSSGEA